MTFKNFNQGWIDVKERPKFWQRKFWITPCRETPCSYLLPYFEICVASNVLSCVLNLLAPSFFFIIHPKADKGFIYYLDRSISSKLHEARGNLLHIPLCFRIVLALSFNGVAHLCCAESLEARGCLACACVWVPGHSYAYKKVVLLKTSSFSLRSLRKNQDISCSGVCIQRQLKYSAV